jgi:hypothetical protein
VTSRNVAGDVIDDVNIAGFSYTTAFVPNVINFQQVEAWPSNAKAKAEYVVRFSPQTPISKGGKIEISFPPV